MRYLVMKPDHPTDLRKVAIGSMETLRELAPQLADCESESQAVEVIRPMFPDVLPLRIPIIAGSKRLSMLGFLDVPSDAKLDLESALPFVLFVLPVPECKADEKDIKHAREFTMTAWMPKVVMPEDAIITPIEVRSTAMPVPIVTRATVGTYKGKLAVQFEIGGVVSSLVFASDRVLDYIAPAPPPEEPVSQL